MIKRSFQCHDNEQEWWERQRGVVCVPEAAVDREAGRCPIFNFFFFSFLFSGGRDYKGGGKIRKDWKMSVN